MAATLTIAIPTYNRAKHLAARLAEILPQLTEGVRLHIFDNCSSDNTAEVAANCQHPNVRYSCARQNMGANRNVCRGLEEAETDWVWILGDDDPVTPTAISDALLWIAETSATAIHFDSNCGAIRRRDLIATLEELFSRHDLTMGFTSSLLFKVPPLRPLYHRLSPAIFTNFPHMSLILGMLEKRIGSLELRPETLLKPVYGGHRWSSLEVALGMSLLPEFIQDAAMQKKAAQNLRIEICWMTVYGLREVHDRASVSKYRRLVRQSVQNLCSYGARRLSLGPASRKPSAKDRKDFFLSHLIPMLPASIIIRLAARMRIRHARDEDVLSEYQ